MLRPMLSVCVALVFLGMVGCGLLGGDKGDAPVVDKPAEVEAPTPEAPAEEPTAEAPAEGEQPAEGEAAEAEEPAEEEKPAEETSETERPSSGGGSKKAGVSTGTEGETTQVARPKR